MFSVVLDMEHAKKTLQEKNEQLRSDLEDKINNLTTTQHLLGAGYFLFATLHVR